MRPDPVAEDRAALAAVNNAVWCDAVCRARGGATMFAGGLWRHADPSPPYFPSAVTLSAEVGDEAVLQALRDAPGGDSVGVKDSFCRLDLASAGFMKLFEARWLWREPTAAAPGAARLRWQVVDAPVLLSSWTRAWWPDPAADPPTPAVFGTPLLADPAVQLLAGLDGEQLVAGAAVTLSDGVTGLSCCFFPPAQAAWLRVELLQAVEARHPGRPLVTYHQGEELQALLGLGFIDVGPLQVWLGRPLAAG